jgi:hypothetical protein
VLFATEVVLRIIAQGAIKGPTAFLADGWGCLDFFIAVTGMIEDFMQAGTLPNMKAIRVAKVLKPLRIITHIPELRLIVSFVLRVTPALNMISLAAFGVVFVFGVIGVQLFQSSLSSRCYNVDDGLLLHLGKICTASEGSSICPTNCACLALASPPNYGVVHFDNVGAAMMTVIQIITLQDWSLVFDQLQAAVNAPLVSVYVVLLVLLGPMFLMKLFLAFIAHKLKQMQLQNRVAQQEDVVKAMQKSRTARILLQWDEGCRCSRLTELQEWPAFRANQMRPSFKVWNASCQSQRMHKRVYMASVGISFVKEEEEVGATVLSLRPGGAALKNGELQVGDYITCVDRTPLKGLNTSEVYKLLNGRRGSRVVITIDTLRRSPVQAQAHKEKLEKISAGRAPAAAGALPADEELREKAVQVGVGTISVGLVRALLPDTNFEEMIQKELKLQEKEELAFYNTVKSVMEPLIGITEEPIPWRDQLHAVVESESFADVISAVIVVNTLCLALKHELSSQIGELWTANDAMLQYLYFRTVLEVLNLLFLFVYSSEALAKILGLGYKEYLSRPANLLDAFIVAIGFYEFSDVYRLFICFWNATKAFQHDPPLPEDIEWTSPCAESGAALTVVRALRLVRLVKLLNRFPTFQSEVMRVVQMLRPLSMLSILICIFILSFTILGMALLGGELFLPPRYVWRIKLPPCTTPYTPLVAMYLSRPPPPFYLSLSHSLSCICRALPPLSISLSLTLSPCSY